MMLHKTGFIKQASLLNETVPEICKISFQIFTRLYLEEQFHRAGNTKTSNLIRISVFPE